MSPVALSGKSNWSSKSQKSDIYAKNRLELPLHLSNWICRAYNIYNLARQYHEEYENKSLRVPRIGLDQCQQWDSSDALFL